MVVNNTLSFRMSLLAASQHVVESWIYQKSESLLTGWQSLAAFRREQKWQ